MDSVCEKDLSAFLAKHPLPVGSPSSFHEPARPTVAALAAQLASLRALSAPYLMGQYGASASQAFLPGMMQNEVRVEASLRAELRRSAGLDQEFDRNAGRIQFLTQQGDPRHELDTLEARQREIQDIANQQLPAATR